MHKHTNVISLKLAHVVMFFLMEIIYYNYI